MSDDRLEAENEQLRKWVSDLQSGLYVNCVYCGHRYGPGETTPVSMADALKAHIEACPAHPMSALKAEIERLREQCKGLYQSAMNNGQDLLLKEAEIERLRRDHVGAHRVGMDTVRHLEAEIERLRERIADKTLSAETCTSGDGPQTT